MIVPFEILKNICDFLGQNEFFILCDALFEDSRECVLALCKARAIQIVIAAGPYVLSERFQANLVHDRKRAGLLTAFRNVLLFSRGMEYYEMSALPQHRAYGDWFGRGLHLDFYRVWMEVKSPSIEMLAGFVNGHELRLLCDCPICHSYVGLASMNSYPVQSSSGFVRMYRRVYEHDDKVVAVSTIHLRDLPNHPLSDHVYNYTSGDALVLADPTSNDYPKILSENLHVIE
jgi:hypothetical protein